MGEADLVDQRTSLARCLRMEGRLVEGLRPDVGGSAQLVAGRDELATRARRCCPRSGGGRDGGTSQYKVPVARSDSTVAGCEDDAVAVGADGSEWASCQPASVAVKGVKHLLGCEASSDDSSIPGCSGILS